MEAEKTGKDLGFFIFFYKGNILVHLGCCNIILQTGQLINNRYVPLTVLETENPRSGGTHGQVKAFLAVILPGGEELWGLSLSLFFFSIYNILFSISIISPSFFPFELFILYWSIAD